MLWIDFIESTLNIIDAQASLTVTLSYSALHSLFIYIILVAVLFFSLCAPRRCEIQVKWKNVF